eukprot:TRINITY_DN10356_c0_g1_i3.p1 TRINITY_DN10356_c0_g1~~TRINITY_DN10356_c0_g1_i3.p1  ORF type:complete len:224 (-),score=53.45 TRINITY_DN10356_c0_g1_i3:255-926(-)
MESDRTALLRKIVEQKTSGSQELFQFFGTSSTILAEAQPESDFDLGQAFETLFLAAQMMVDVLLDKFGYYFEEKFGTEFLDQFECNIFQLTMEDLSDLDAFLVEMTAPFLEREKSKLISRNASFLVQKMPNLWHTLHFMDPLELPTLEYVSPEFTRYFGWNICEIQSMSLSVIPMIDMVCRVQHTDLPRSGDGAMLMDLVDWINRVKYLLGLCIQHRANCVRC